MEELATQAEEAADPVKDKQSKPLTTEKEIEEKWAEHFQETLNRSDPENIKEKEEAEEDLDINIEPPTKEEIIRAIKTLKTTKPQEETA
ncbi:hypothetical protein DPMN_082826 [Dreissena polymorpha]|uniref:Uncharacterized protein n=1 Tax=Dreissena polymorpha TaxID=45954 RepID=A0A9D3YBA7_DREPO|nr:hypothetical protein DPMN_082826 [Dreissena polymorpha]